jgi:hypothetical protein
MRLSFDTMTACDINWVYCTISFNSAVTHHAPPPEHRIVTLVTLILARCRKLSAKSKSHNIFFFNYTTVQAQKFVHES